MSTSGTERPDLHLVIGATGLLGREIVCQARVSGLRVRVLVRNEQTFRKRLPDPDIAVIAGDLEEGKLVRHALAGVSVVHYCAFDPRPGAQRDHLQAIRLLVDACARQDAHLLYASNLLVYGPHAEVPIGETAPLRGHRGLYAPVHRPAEVEIAIAAHERLLHATWLRLSPLIGANTDPAAGRPLLECIRQGKLLVDAIPAARQIDYLDPRDAARCFLLAARNPSVYGLAVNVRGCGPVQRRTFVQLVADRVGKPLHRIEIPSLSLRPLVLLEPYMADLALMAKHNLVLDGSRAEQLLGFKPEISYRDAIDRVLQGQPR